MAGKGTGWLGTVGVFEGEEREKLQSGDAKRGRRRVARLWTRYEATAEWSAPVFPRLPVGPRPLSGTSLGIKGKNTIISSCQVVFCPRLQWYDPKRGGTRQAEFSRGLFETPSVDYCLPPPPVLILLAGRVSIKVARSGSFFFFYVCPPLPVGPHGFAQAVTGKDPRFLCLGRVHFRPKKGGL